VCEGDGEMKLSKAQAEVLERMKSGDALIRHRVGYGNPKRYYHRSGIDVPKATVESLEKKGLIEIDYSKRDEVNITGYRSIDYEYKLTGKDYT
jgi:hypothetical protein